MSQLGQANTGQTDQAIVGSSQAAPPEASLSQAPAGMAEQGKGAAQGQAETDWNFLPQEMADLKTGHATPQDFWAHVGKMTQSARQQEAMTQTPNAAANAEEKSAWWQKLGKPDKADGYALPESLNLELPTEILQGTNSLMAESRNEFMQLAHAANLTQEQAAKLYELTALSVGQNMAAEAAQSDPAKVLAELWPTDTAKNLDYAKRGARALGIGDQLDAAGLSTNPLVLQLAHALGQEKAEGPMQRANTPNVGLPTGQSAYQQLLQVVSSDAYKRQEPASVRMAEELSKRVNMQ